MADESAFAVATVAVTIDRPILLFRVTTDDQNMPETVPAPVKPDEETEKSPAPASPKPKTRPSPFDPPWPEDRPLPQPKGQAKTRRILDGSKEPVRLDRNGCHAKV